MLGMDLLLGKSQNLIAVLVIVFATADMNPEVTSKCPNPGSQRILSSRKLSISLPRV